MKINFYVTVLLPILLFSFTLELRSSNSPSNTDSNTDSNTNKSGVPSHLEKVDPKNLWEKLFTVTRTTNCAQTRNFNDLVNEVLNAYSKVGAASNKFYWVKEWGFGPVSYLFDYLDPVFKNDTVIEFKNIYDKVSKFSNEDLPEYQDSLNLAQQMKNADYHVKYKYAKMLKEFNQKANSAHFGISINTVQLHKALPALGWKIQNDQGDYAKDFVLKYDIDGDGRLNARELVLGFIRENKANVAYKTCINCLKKTITKIDSMFEYFNCANTGFIDAEQMWNALPQLTRKSNKYNIFGIKNSLSIRTNAINDLVLKNMKVKEGFLSKDEFRQGILLGFWDRQTTQSGVIDGDSRNLKELRWSQDGMVDTVAYNYMKETIILELKQKAEERKQAMIKYKDQN